MAFHLRKKGSDIGALVSEDHFFSQRGIEIAKDMLKRDSRFSLQSENDFIGPNDTSIIISRLDL